MANFLYDFCGCAGLQPDSRFAFSSHTKRKRHKSLWVLLHLTLCKAYVRPSCSYSAQKMDCRKGQRKRPCPLECVTKPSNKITCQGSLLFGSVSISPQPFVTSNKLLWCFRHIFLMFYTPYNLLCFAKPILLPDVIDGARDPAEVNPVERPWFLSPWRWQEHISTLTVTLSQMHIHTRSHNNNNYNVLASMSASEGNFFKMNK